VEEVAADKESQYFSHIGKRQIRTLLFPYYLYLRTHTLKILICDACAARQIRSTEATKEGEVEEKEEKRRRDAR